MQDIGLAPPRPVAQPLLVSSTPNVKISLTQKYCIFSLLLPATRWLQLLVGRAHRTTALPVMQRFSLSSL
jgi:hypothetical protein